MSLYSVFKHKILKINSASHSNYICIWQDGIYPHRNEKKNWVLFMCKLVVSLFIYWLNKRKGKRESNNSRTSCWTLVACLAWHTWVGAYSSPETIITMLSFQFIIIFVSFMFFFFHVKYWYIPMIILLLNFLQYNKKIMDIQMICAILRKRGYLSKK